MIELILKKHIEKHFKDHPDEVSKMNKDTFWLKRQNIDKYEKIPCNNARLNRVMSHVFKENAEQLLDAAMQDEKELQERVMKQMQVQPRGELDKDW